MYLITQDQGQYLLYHKDQQFTTLDRDNDITFVLRNMVTMEVQEQKYALE